MSARCPNPFSTVRVFGIMLAFFLISCHETEQPHEGQGYLIIVPEAVSSAVADLAD
jgi:hypothetical protein